MEPRRDTKRVAEGTAAPWEPTDEDFESWDDDRDERAFAELSRSFAVRHAIGDRHYFAKTPRGKVYKMPLGISIATFEALTAADDDADSIGAFKAFLAEIAPGQADEIEREPIQTVVSLMTDYMACVARAQGTTLGESAASPAM